MSEITRRFFGQQAMGSLLTFSLLENVFAADAVAAPIKPITARWLEDINQISRDHKGKKLSQVEWQKKVEALFKQIDLPEFLKYVDFDKLLAQVKYPERGPRSVQAKFPQVEGLPTRLEFGHQIFIMKKNRAIVPHGHNNMATAFVILDGKFEGRHYDRLEDQEKHIIIKPTIDRTFSPGDASSISDIKDNVHWFKPISEKGYVFNVRVLTTVNPGKRTGRVYVDPNGEKISAGRIRARRINSDEAHKLYG